MASTTNVDSDLLNDNIMKSFMSGASIDRFHNPYQGLPQQNPYESYDPNHYPYQSGYGL